MSLKDIKLKHSYNSDNIDILKDFYIPVLKESIKYYRLAGFFSSNALAAAAKGIKGFLDNNGEMFLVCSASLSEKDIQALKDGVEKPEEIIKEAAVDEIDSISNEFIRDNVKLVSWMVATKKLKIKIAVVKDNFGNILTKEQVRNRGIFHPKVGIVEDADGNRISFSGSNNESLAAWMENIDRFKTFRNWGDSFERNSFQSDFDDFMNFWNGNAKRTEVYDLPDAIEKKLMKIAPRDQIELETIYERILKEYGNRKKYRGVDGDYLDGINEPGVPYGEPLIPDYIKLRPYQFNADGDPEESAITSWFHSNKNGILKMATGTGKTITALALASKLFYKNNKKLAIVVACPYQHLVQQWNNSAKEFNLKPILAYESTKKWEKKLNRKITDFNIGISNVLTVITTHKTFGLKIMRETLSKLSEDTLLIIDEVHHFGAKHLSTSLPEQINWRLGLSATPHDWYDESRNEILDEYFSEGIIFNYGLKKAIENNWLTKYYYYPHLVELTSEESEEYYDLSRKIASLISRDENIELSENEVLKRLLIKRARLLGTAQNKIKKLKKLIYQRLDSKHNLVYCGDGKVEGIRQIDTVIKLLGMEMGMKVHPFTAKESHTERKDLLRRFEQGDLQSLVAIRCLDEGVDVPATKTAYILASSTNPRQFIQRRGRILRKEKDKKYSYIHDFIVMPPKVTYMENLESHQFNLERGLLEKELRRVSYFADLAQNGPIAQEKLLDLKRNYNLLNV